MEKKKLFGIIIGVIAFIALVAGATYAWFYWTSGPTTIGGTSAKFEINYLKGEDITGNLTPSTDKTGGLNTTVQISRTADSITGTAKLELTNITLTQAYLGSCSNPAYSTQTDCTTNDGTWTPVTADWTALKWEVYNGGTSVASGNFGTLTDGAYTGTGKITLFNGQTLNTAAVSYTVYIWLDGAAAGNEYIGAALAAKIAASAVQTG